MAWGSGGLGGGARLCAKPCLHPTEDGPCGAGATSFAQCSAAHSGIRLETEGRSEGRRLGYLCLQQQHVEVGDRLSVDAQELQFTSQSVCELSDLKLPGRKGEESAAALGCRRWAAVPTADVPGVPLQSRGEEACSAPVLVAPSAQPAPPAASAASWGPLPTPSSSQLQISRRPRRHSRANRSLNNQRL